MDILWGYWTSLYAHVHVMHLYLQVTLSKMRKHTNSESFWRISSSRISSSFPVLRSIINMILRQQNGIVWLKYTLHAYTLHAYMHKLCACEIHVTTMHHCTHTRMYLYAFGTQIDPILKHYTLHLTGTVYTCTCTCTMWNCSLIVMSLTL